MTTRSTSSNSKGAPLVKQGHTSTGQYGSAVNPRNPTRKAPRDLNLK